MRKPLKYFALTYLLIGLSIGILLGTAVPATTVWGILYLTVIWPYWIMGNHLGLTVCVPSWAFEYG